VSGASAAIGPGTRPSGIAGIIVGDRRRRPTPEELGLVIRAWNDLGEAYTNHFVCGEPFLMDEYNDAFGT
jgi:hypothetical protein